MSEKLLAGIDYVGIATPFYCNDGDGNFLMHKRSDEARDEHGRWDFGSEQLEIGERVEECVLRGVMEEWGIVGTIQEQLPAHDIIRTIGDVQSHWLVVPFFVKVDVVKAKISEEKKFSEMEIFRLDNLPQPLHTGVLTTMDRFPEAFAMYR